MALASALFFLSAPATRPGAGELTALRAAEILGRLGPGEGLPTLPALDRILGAVLAGFLRLTSQVPEGAPDATAGAAGTFLRVLAALAAGVCLVSAVRIAGRLTAPSSPAAPVGGTAPGLASAASAAAASVAGLALLVAPLLPQAVAQLSPALLGGLLVLVLTERLLGSRNGTDLRWGIAAGLGLGLVLGLLAWLWIVPVLFLVAALLQRRGAAAVGAAFVTALALALALDPVRLVTPLAGGRQILTEWMRAGGWNLGVAPLGSAGLPEFLALPTAAGWGLLPAFLVALGVWARRRSVVALGWWGGLWVLLSLVPAASGIRVPGALQQVFVLCAVIAGAATVGDLLARPGRGRLLGFALAFFLLVGAFAARVGAARSAGTAPVEAVVNGCAEWVPSGALLLAERDLPGLGEHGAVQTLPRDSRRPDRYDFAYWTRWYADFGWALLSEVQMGQNSGRDAPLHFYGQLRAAGEPVARWGEPGNGWVLYRLGESSDWTRPPTAAELGALRPSPDLLGYLDQLGGFLARAGRRESARRMFQAGIELAPERESFYNNLGSVYLLEGEWEEAARICEQGLERNPRSAELCYNAGRAYSELGVHVRAESLLRRAVGLRPEFLDAHYELARTFLALDQPALARRALEQVLALGPDAERRAAVESVLARLASEGTGEDR